MPSLRQVSTPEAPAAIGPYSQAVAADGWIYVSGQIALDPGSGEVVEGDVRAQTHRVLRNLSAILQAGGATMDTVVKTTIYLSEMQNFSEVNDVYSEYFRSHRPARATVAVAGLPKGVDIEVDAVARVAG